MNLKTSRHNHEQCEAKEEKFAKTSSKLHDINFSHHHEDTCVCESCNCGRHLCKMNIIKPDLNKNTIYQRSYNNKVPMPTLVTYAKDTKRL